MGDFGELEALAMEQIWDGSPPISARHVLDGLAGKRTLAYTTICTVMDHLYRKGWLTREKVGLAYRYQPVCSREEYLAGLMRKALSDSRDQTAVLTHFVHSLSPVETQALRDALRRAIRRRSAR